MDNVPNTPPNPIPIGSTSLGPARYQIDVAQAELVVYRHSGDRDAGFTALTAIDKAVEELQALRRRLALELNREQT